MTHQEFLSEASRLINRYGDKYYPKEVLEVFYTEVGLLSHSWWSRLVSKFVAYEKFAPNLTNIREASKIEKETLKQARIKTYLHKKESIKSQFSEEEVVELLRTVKAVSNGKMSNEARESYCEMLESSLKARPYAIGCSKCGDTGLVLKEAINGAPIAFKCYCTKGSHRRENFERLRD